MPDRAIDVWRRKLEYLQKAEATASDPAQLFSIREQIKEAEQRIAELKLASPQDSAPQARRAAPPPADSLGEPQLTEHAENEAFDVFLSHNSMDKPHVREIAQRLSSRGVKVWLDEWELRPGLTWMDALEDIIEGCGSAAVCIGPNGMGAWEEPEMQALLRRFAREKKRKEIVPVIPTLLPGAPVDITLPPFLEAFTGVDLRGGITGDGLDKLQWGITGKKPDGLGPIRGPAAALSDGVVSELTTTVNQQIARSAEEWLETECAPFVIPSLARHRMSHEPGSGIGPSRQRQPLDEDKINQISVGNLPRDANRVRIVGDSGMGKTALLHYCELQVAKANDGRLPVRIDGLSGYNWTLGREEIFQWIIDRLLHRWLPADVKPDTAVLWLSELAAQGKVVFLLDALDQADQQLNEAGLRTFLQSIGVIDCPVIITLRPEVERHAVFSAVNWDTVHAEGFHEPAQRQRYLGDLAGDLLVKDDEQWQSPESYERKQQWADLLEIPLLLKMLRELAFAEREERSPISLSQLRNRHAVYREAVAYLVRQGLDSAKDGPFRDTLYDAREVDERLTEIAWATIAQGEGNFTATLEGKSFSQLRKDLGDVDVLRALQQVDVITRHNVFDRYGESGLAWRHRSFSEYFGGKYLAQPDRNLQTDVAQRHGRDPSWQWVFRFALSEIDAENRRTHATDHHLAQALIKYGNPFVVYDAIKRDSVTLPAHLSTLCRWLVHRDWGDPDYRDAWQESEPPPMDDRWIQTLESLFEREHRNSRCLHPAWQLVEHSDEPWAVSLRERFLSEFPKLLTDTKCAEHAVARTLADTENFARCPLDPAADGQPFRMGSAEKEEYEIHAETPQHEVRITPFHLQRTPVSNLQFELFDPSLRLGRGENRPGDDHPAVYVSWYMAELFCVWLGEAFRLPTEAEWEYAARAGTTTRYWWGDTFDESKCHSGESKMRHTLPPDASRANAWGLIDMLGNVWEWCLDGVRDYTDAAQMDPVGPCELGSIRVSRGGSWDFVARYCRSAYRDWSDPEFRYYYLGFRLARSSVESSTSKSGA